MKRKYDVIWSEMAEKDLIDIIRFIANDSLSNASKVFKKIRNRAKSLNHSPHRGRIIPELRDQGITQYRELIISHWRLMYRISDRYVYVVSVLDARQNVEDILFRRLTDTAKFL